MVERRTTIMTDRKLPEGVYYRVTSSGKTWCIRYRVNGLLIREKVGRECDGIARQHAINARKSRMGDIVQGRFRLPEVRKSVPFRDLITRYHEYAATSKRSYSKERYTLEALARTFGRIPLAKLTPWAIERWKSDRRGRIAAATLNRELTTLKAVLSKAVEWDLLDKSPAASVKYLHEDNRRVRWLTSDELGRLLAAAAADVAVAWLVPAITLAVHTGLRQGELLRLRWEDVTAGGSKMSLWNTKSGKPRHIPLNTDARAILATLPREGTLVLAWPWRKPISRITLYHAFRRAVRRAGVSHCTWHDLRHTFASHMVMAGVDLATVKELLGHETLEMTMRYAHLAPQHSAQAVERLTGLFISAAPTPEAPTGAGGARREHAVSGRQSTAKREYLQRQAVREWRRGESNPRPSRRPRNPEVPYVARCAELLSSGLTTFPRLALIYHPTWNETGTRR